MNFNGNSAGSRNSSNASRGPSNSSANRANRFGGYNPPARPNPNRPVPNYMRPRGQTNSADRVGSNARSNSNKNGRFLPTNYKPPHLRGNSNNQRVSPARVPGQSSGYGPTNRASPNTRLQQNQKINQPATNNRKSPGSRLYANVQSRLHNPAPRVTRDGSNPVKNLSADRRAGIKPSPTGNRFGVDYRGVRANNNAANDRSNSRDRAPKVNNFTRGDSGQPTNPVHDRLYNR